MIIQAQYFHYIILETKPLSALEEFKEHRRLRVFYNKGCKCVECGVEGTQLALGDGRGRLHWDIYTDDFYPLTVDHIIPKSKGGSDDLENLQPMCYLCNTHKGNGDKPSSWYFSAKIYRSMAGVEKDGIDANLITIKTRGKLVDRKKEYKIGDEVWSTTDGKYVGVIKELKINEFDPKKNLAAVIHGRNEKSLFSIRSIGVLPKEYRSDKIKQSRINYLNYCNLLDKVNVEE